MSTDTTVNNLVINKLTKAQYDAIQSPSDTEIYLVPDVIDTTPTSGSDNMVTSGGVYNALSNKADASDIPVNVSDLNNDAGYTTNAGTVTSVTVNGSTYSPTNGDVNLGTIGGGGGGLSVQADWAQTNSSAADYIKNKPDIGATYTAAWTASSSAAVNVTLTADLTLPKGVYLVRVGFPVLNKALAAANLVVGGAATRDTNIFYSGSTYFSGFEIVTVGDGGGTVHLQTQSSTSITYTYLERGGLVAVKFV